MVGPSLDDDGLCPTWPLPGRRQHGDVAEKEAKDPQDSLTDDGDLRRLERARPHRATQLLTSIIDSPWMVALVWGSVP